MPTYDYHCHANTRTVEVRHAMHESVSTWGEVCARAGVDPGDTPADAAVEKIFTTSQVVNSRHLGSGLEPPCASGGPCCNPGGGMCGMM